MTTLFSVFAPLFFFVKIKFSLILLILMSFIFILLLSESVSNLIFTKNVSLFSKEVALVLMPVFFILVNLNLFSMVVYSYPVTTTLGFNLGGALTCWLCGIFIQINKFSFLSSVLPQNAPWYLIPFLCLVELISVAVRPLTLCFRLLANMVAGHVLIALICKMPGVWALGSMFGILELAVSVVQAFVFSMLISVYLEEAFTH